MNTLVLIPVLIILAILAMVFVVWLVLKSSSKIDLDFDFKNLKFNMRKK